jgi:TrmH family RNA methyltransferase
VPRTVSTRNAAFQQWQALLTNCTKRQRAGEFLVQGVRPITLAVEHDWEIRVLLHAGGPRSRWAEEMLRRHDHAELSEELMRELGEKDEQELIAVVGLPEDSLDRISPRDDLLVVVFDRPATPGNIGTLIRSAGRAGSGGDSPALQHRGAICPARYGIPAGAGGDVGRAAGRAGDRTAVRRVHRDGRRSGGVAPVRQ